MKTFFRLFTKWWFWFAFAGVLYFIKVKLESPANNSQDAGYQPAYVNSGGIK